MTQFLKKVSSIVAAGLVTFGLSGILALAPVGATDRAMAVGLNDGLTATKTSDMPEQLDGSSGLFNKIVNVLLFIIAAVAVIMIIVGGIRYVSSNGDQANVKAAKDTIMYAIIGLIVAILAYAVVNFVITNVK